MKLKCHYEIHRGENHTTISRKYATNNKLLDQSYMTTAMLDLVVEPMPVNQVTVTY